jgi:hypothetical protein
MPHQKLIRVLNYIWLLVVFPVAVAILVGVHGHSVNLRINLGIKTFLLIECGMAVLSPLLNAVISDGNHTYHHRRKESSSSGILEGLGAIFSPLLFRDQNQTIKRMLFTWSDD